MADTKTVEGLLSQLQAESNPSGGRAIDLTKAQQLVSKLKLELIKFQLVPPFKGDEQTVRKQLFLARETFELAALVSVAAKDVEAFQRNIGQLRPFYKDFSSKLPASDRQWPLIGLQLLSLLASNQIGAFHTELETIEHKDQERVYIKFALQLEQWLMEGSFGKILKAGKTLPAPQFAFFVDILSQTVRDKVADCSSEAYESLPVGEAKQVLMLESDAAVLSYAQKRGWTVSNGVILFKPSSSSSSASSSMDTSDDAAAAAASAGAGVLELPSEKLINRMLHYAAELERIV